MTIDELQEKYDDALIKAAKPINDMVHAEIVTNLKKLKKILKLDKIHVLMGMGGWRYQHINEVDCIEIFKGKEEHYKASINDLEFKDYGGRDDVVDKSILPIIDRLLDLYHFLTDNSHTQPREFIV